MLNYQNRFDIIKNPKNSILEQKEMIHIFSFFILLILVAAPSVDGLISPSPCIWNASQIVYVNSTISATQTFLRCLQNIPESSMLPNFYDGNFNGVANFSVRMTLNDLISVENTSKTLYYLFYNISLNYDVD